MRAVLVAIVASIASVFRSRWALQLEVLALRHQLAVYQRAGRRARLGAADRIFWALLSRAWSGWRAALVFVQPRTVIGWQRKQFRRLLDALESPGKERTPADQQGDQGPDSRMSNANPTWGSPRI